MRPESWSFHTYDLFNAMSILKRIVISLVVTILAVSCLYNIWLPKGVALSFCYETEREARFGIIYYDGDRKETLVYRSPQNRHEAEIIIPCEDMTRLRFNMNSDSKHVILKNIKLEGKGKVVLLNKLTDWKFQNISKKEENEGLIYLKTTRTPKSVITNAKRFHVTASRHFQICRLIWLALVVFCCSWCIIDSVRNNNTLDIESTLKSREPAIDFLRTMGIFLIILAHCCERNLLFQIRTFDVPMMIFLSGLSYSGRRINSCAKFYWDRCLRLLIPVYSFAIVFGVVYVAMRWDYIHECTGALLGALLLTKGIHYEWIYRVFLLMMLITPLCLIVTNWAASKIRQLLLWVSISALFFLQNEYISGLPQDSWLNQYIIPFLSGYAILYLIGINYKKSSLNAKILCSIIFSGVAIYHAYREGFTPQQFKYPPRELYLAYGIACSLVLILLVSFIANKITVNARIRYFCYFHSSRTIWLFIWHGPFVLLIPYYGSWYERYILVLLSAIALTTLQNKFVEKLQCLISDPRAKRWLQYFKT